jgi:hypothetical protein
MWQAEPLCTALFVQESTGLHYLPQAISKSSDGMNRALIRATMRLQLLTIALSLPMAACAMEVTGEDEPGLDDSEIILHNKLRTEDIVLNSLTGTTNAINLLVANPLSTATFSGAGPIPNALKDPNARSFATYLAQCALSKSQSFTYFNDVTGRNYTFSGLHGLCPAWGTGPASAACRQIVSACILSRNNALGDEVQLSVLGKQVGGTPLATSATVQVKSTNLDGVTTPSFVGCKTALSGPSRNCGFSASKSLVGVCNPGADVTLNCKVGSSEFVTRVCDGPDGCSHLSSLNLLEDTVCSPEVPSTTFTCGDDGAFAVLVGPVNSSLAVGGSFSNATGGVFPASELQVYAIEEGSFYGDLFKGAEHSSIVSRTVDASGVITSFFPDGATIDVYGDAFACHDPDWTDGMAYLSHRLCAIDVEIPVGGITHTGTLCASRKLGPCTGPMAPTCGSDDTVPVGDGDNGSCHDDLGALRPYPLTTRLHQPCDLIPPGLEAVCERRVIIN